MVGSVDKTAVDQMWAEACNHHVMIAIMVHGNTTVSFIIANAFVRPGPQSHSLHIFVLGLRGLGLSPSQVRFACLAIDKLPLFDGFI